MLIILFIFRLANFIQRILKKICQLKSNNMKNILAQYFMLRLGNITCRLDYMGQKHLKINLQHLGFTYSCISNYSNTSLAGSTIWITLDTFGHVAALVRLQFSAFNTCPACLKASRMTKTITISA